jgi:type IV pilus assembly protein PilV
MLDHQKARGFTLIEVLVSTIILAIGLLGLAAMQTLALKDNQDAFFYSQASTLAYEMSDRMKVNPSGWSATIPEPSDAKNCDLADPCSVTDMASYDYWAWQSNIQNRIASDATAVVSRINATTLRLTIIWTRNHQQDTNTGNQFVMDVTP